MGYGKRRHLSTLTLPALYGAITISFVAYLCFSSELYIGSLYIPSFEELMEAVVASPLATIPVLLFALFAIWPAALISAEIAQWVSRRAKRQGSWSIWLLTGALVGGPALYLYSFPLGLGRTMLGPLFLNGALLGIGCAAFVRKFVKPDVDDPSAVGDPEQSHDAV